MLTSIAIPVYEMNGQGIHYLKHNLNKIIVQKINFDLEVIISDQSKNDIVKNYINDLGIDYIKYIKANEKVNSLSSNTNNAIRYCSGDIIKVLYQDDYFLNEYSLQKTIDTISNSNKMWLISACEHSKDLLTLIRPFYPQWNDHMIFGNNTYSCPSVLSFKKEAKDNYFDENLDYLLDTEYYWRMKNKYGEPVYLQDITVVISIHQNQSTNSVSMKSEKELDYIIKKYAN